MSTGPSRRRLALFLGTAVVVSAAALTAASLFSVPAGSIVACGGRIYETGWHLRKPFQQVHREHLSGRVEAIDVDRRDGGGATTRVRLSFSYSLSPERLRARAPDLERVGVHGLATAIAQSALEPFPPASFVSSGRPAAGGGHSPLPSVPRAAVADALRQAGLEPIDLDGRVGAIEAFDTPIESRLTASRAPSDTSMPAREETGVRLLLIGLDGADWDLIDPLVRAGRLPHLARLIRNGTRASMRSYDPMISPLLWTTMVTGVGPDHHGVADFQAIDQDTGRRVPITSRFRKVKALWNILSDAGLESAFVAWWASYPAETVLGYQVSNLVAFQTIRPGSLDRAAASGSTYPAGYLAEIGPSLITAADLSYEEVASVVRIDRAEFEAARREVLNPPADDEETERRRMAQRPVPLTLSILTGTRNYATIGADLAARRPALTAVYFEGIDMMGHRFQHCMPPRTAICPEVDFNRFRDAVTSFYVRQDELLGDVLRAAGPDTTVMVVSDHGFRSGGGRPVDLLPYTTRQPVEWHDREGIFLLSGPGARRGERPAERATLFDVAPTILHLLGLPVSEEMPGRVFLPAIDPEFARAHAVRTVRSYETLGTARRAVARGEDAVTRQAEEDLLASLQALGYIGGNDDGPGAGTQVFYHRNLATYFLKQQEYARAAEQLRLANERRQLPKNYEMLSEAYLGMGRRSEALEVLREMLETQEDANPESVLWMVQIHLSDLRDRQAALDDVRRFAARTATRPGLDDAIAGLLLEDAGDAQGAVDRYRRSLAADPTRVVAAQRLYVLTSPRDRAPTLEPLLRGALSRDPRIDEYHNLLGAILAETGREAEAVDSFRRAVDLDPDNARFAANLAAALARREQWEEASVAYERASTLAPSAPTSMRLGSVYRRLQRPERALSAFERARALGDRGSGPLLGMALARVEMDQIPEALAVIRRGLDDHPDDPALRSLYRDLLQKAGPEERATIGPGSR